VTASQTQTLMLDRPGGRIGYDVSGAGPLVVCVPGMGELRSVYRFTVPALAAAGLRAATMDLRGHGDSDATFASYHDVAAGSDVLALTGQLGGPAVVIGNSMGAGAGVRAAAERPGQVAGLALAGPFARNPTISPLMRRASRLAMSGPWAVRAWLAWLPRLYPSGTPGDFAGHLASLRQSMRRPGHATAFAATTRTSHAPAQERLPRVTGKPVLIVMGAKDPDFPDPRAEAEQIRSQLDAELLLVPGAGHYPQAEMPDAVNPALVRFCQEATAGA